MISLIPANTVKKLKKYWQLFWLFRHFALMKMMAYRADFWFWAGVSIMWTTFNFFFFSLIINLRGEVVGWSRWELYALLSVYTMLDAIFWSFFNHNMWSYTHRIFNGQLSLLLIKPVDPQFLIMTGENSYNNVPRFFVGVAGVVWSLWQLGHWPTWFEWLGFVVAFGAGILFVYNVWFLIATLAFWVERLTNINDIVPALRKIWQMPREVYSGFSSILLIIVLPFALVGAVPTEFITGRASWVWLAYLVAAAAVSFYVSRWFFFFSSRKYTSSGG